MTIIRILDFETTGLPDDEAAKVCETGYCDLILENGVPTVSEAYWASLYGVTAMPVVTRAVHHISMAMVADLPPYIPSEMWDMFIADGVNAVAAHNSAFESAFWGAAPVPVICTMKSAMRVWPDAPGFSNQVLRYWLEEDDRIVVCPDTADPPHRAGPDAYVTAHILSALFQAGATGKEMAAWTKEPAMLPRCPIGEWRGKRWSEVDAGFLTWMIKKPVEADLVWNAKRELERRRHG